MVPSSLVTGPRRTCGLMARGTSRPKGFGRNNERLPASPATGSISTNPQSRPRDRHLSLDCGRRSERTRLRFRHLKNRDAPRNGNYLGHQGSACIRTHAPQAETSSARPQAMAIDQQRRTSQGQSNIQGGGGANSILGAATEGPAASGAFRFHWGSGSTAPVSVDSIALAGGCRGYFFGSANTMYEFILGAAPAGSRGAW